MHNKYSNMRTLFTNINEIIKIKPWIQLISRENSTEIVVAQCKGRIFGISQCR